MNFENSMWLHLSFSVIVQNSNKRLSILLELEVGEGTLLPGGWYGRV